MGIFGLSDPIKKVYLAAEPVDYLSLIVFTFINQQVGNLVFDKKLNTLIRKKKEEAVDYTCILTGTMVFMNQFNVQYTESFLALCAQYIKSGVGLFPVTKDTKLLNEMKTDVANHIIFFEDYIRNMGESPEYAENYLSLSLLVHKDL